MKTIAVHTAEKGRLTLALSIREAFHVQPRVVFCLQPEADGDRIVKVENPFDVLAGHAVREYKAGKTRDLREQFESWAVGI